MYMGWDNESDNPGFRADDNRIINSILKCLDYFNNNAHIQKCSLYLLFILDPNSSYNINRGLIIPWSQLIVLLILWLMGVPHLIITLMSELLHLIMLDIYEAIWIFCHHLNAFMDDCLVILTRLVIAHFFWSIYANMYFHCL